MEEIVKEGKISVATIVIRLVWDFIMSCIFIGIIWMINDIIAFYTTKLIITNKKITGKTGLINTNQLDSSLNKISGIQVEQGLFGKIFNFGTISVTTASASISFKYIDKPNEFRNILNAQIEAYDESRIEAQAKKIAEAVKK